MRKNKSRKQELIKKLIKRNSNYKNNKKNYNN